MANTIPSPNMLLPVPTVGIDTGPDWATNLNACLSIIDQHNHSVGSGVQITPSGLNISSDLPFNSNNATNLRSVLFSPQPAALATPIDIGNIYTVTSGGQTNLFYNNGSATPIQITSGTSVNAGAGSITGLPSGTASASFASSTFKFQSATNTPATVDGGSFIFRNLTANSFGITLSPPNALANNSSLVLPAVPASQSFMSLDASGNMAAYAPVAGGIATSNIAAGAITSSKIASNTIVAGNVAPGALTPVQLTVVDPGGGGNFYASAVLGSGFSTSSSTQVHATGLDSTLAIFSANRPAIVTCSGPIPFINITGSGVGVSFTMTLTIRVTDGVSSSTIATYTFSSVVNPATGALNVPLWPCTTDVFGPSQGYFTYQVWAGLVIAGGGAGTMNLPTGFTMKVVQV